MKIEGDNLKEPVTLWQLEARYDKILVQPLKLHKQRNQIDLADDIKR